MEELHKLVSTLKHLMAPLGWKSAQPGDLAAPVDASASDGSIALTGGLRDFGKMRSDLDWQRTNGEG